MLLCGKIGMFFFCWACARLENEGVVSVSVKCVFFSDVFCHVLQFTSACVLASASRSSHVNIIDDVYLLCVTRNIPEVIASCCVFLLV